MDERHQQACFLVGMGNTHAATATALGYPQRQRVTEIVHTNRALVQQISDRKNLVMGEVLRLGSYQSADIVSQVLTKIQHRLLFHEKTRWMPTDALTLAKTAETMHRICRELDEMSKNSAPPSQQPNIQQVTQSLAALDALTSTPNKSTSTEHKP